MLPSSQADSRSGRRPARELDSVMEVGLNLTKQRRKHSVIVCVTFQQVLGVRVAMDSL